MRRTLALAAIAVSATAFLAPLSTASAGCAYVKPVGCLPSTCLLVADVVSTVNNAAGRPLTDLPQCVD